MLNLKRSASSEGPTHQTEQVQRRPGCILGEPGGTAAPGAAEVGLPQRGAVSAVTTLRRGSSPDQARVRLISEAGPQRYTRPLLCDYTTPFFAS